MKEGRTTAINPLLMANPVCSVELSGEGKIDLILFDWDLLLHVTVYISRDRYFKSLQVTDIIHHSTTTISGEDLQVGVLDLKEKVLDIMDRRGLYCVYLEEYRNKHGVVKYQNINRGVL